MGHKFAQASARHLNFRHTKDKPKMFQAQNMKTKTRTSQRNVYFPGRTDVMLKNKTPKRNTHIQPQLIAKKRFGGQSDLCHPKECSLSLKPMALFCLKIFLQRVLASRTEIKLSLQERNQQINKTQARYRWICFQAVARAKAVGLSMPPLWTFSRISLEDPGSDSCSKYMASDTWNHTNNESKTTS